MSCCTTDTRRREALSVKHEAVENEGQVHFQSEKEYSHVASFIDCGLASRMQSADDHGEDDPRYHAARH